MATGETRSRTDPQGEAGGRGSLLRGALVTLGVRLFDLPSS